MRARSGGRIDLRACACGVAVAEDLAVLLNHPVLDRVTTCVHRGLLSLGPTPLREHCGNKRAPGSTGYVDNFRAARSTNRPEPVGAPRRASRRPPDPSGPRAAHRDPVCAASHAVAKQASRGLVRCVGGVRRTVPERCGCGRGPARRSAPNSSRGPPSQSARISGHGPPSQSARISGRMSGRVPGVSTVIRPLRRARPSTRVRRLSASDTGRVGAAVDAVPMPARRVHEGRAEPAPRCAVDTAPPQACDMGRPEIGWRGAISSSTLPPRPEWPGGVTPEGGGVPPLFRTLDSDARSHATAEHPPIGAAAPPVRSPFRGQ
jgi:hypothetical protein